MHILIDFHQVFAGPMSESVPSSATGFAHRRPRADSVASFTYFQEDDEEPSYSEEAIEDISDEEIGYADGDDLDLEAGSLASSRHRKSSGRSRISADQPLLTRHGSHRSDTREHGLGGSFSQKLYIDAEDLTIVIAGFKTSVLGDAAYMAICIATLGIGYLLFRWLPRWRIQLIGSPTLLRECSWVVIEVSSWCSSQRPKKSAEQRQNQWGEFTVHPISTESYGHVLSTIFASTEKEVVNGYHDDDDPVVDTLRVLDYRYMRLIYHPVEDKFALNNSWKDPLWNNVKSLREGLDSDERDIRHQVFGKNVIDIHQKTIPQLLLDEVSTPFKPSLLTDTRRHSIRSTSFKSLA